MVCGGGETDAHKRLAAMRRPYRPIRPSSRCSCRGHGAAGRRTAVRDGRSESPRHLPERRDPEERTMLRNPRPSCARTPSALGRWLKYAWLDRLPQLTAWLRDRLTGRAKTADHRRDPKRSFHPEVAYLETRFIPNDMLGVLTAGPLLGSGLALTGGFTTPALALLRGFGDNRAP